jgi:hypothetical protein
MGPNRFFPPVDEIKQQEQESKPQENKPQALESKPPLIRHRTDNELAPEYKYDEDLYRRTFG